MDESLAARIAAGLAVVRGQIDYFKQYFGKAESLWKHDGSRVTPADIAISRAIFAELARQFPDDQLFSEETEPGGPPIPVTSRYCWVLDPIDGTNNYALGLPVCAISLGLLENGMPVCGFIYDHAAQVLLHGGPGLGLFADGQPFEVQAREMGDTPVVAMHSPVAERYLPAVELVLKHYKMRGWGSGALHLTYVALRRVSACVDFTVKVWDVAAAWAFCQVTGVKIVSFGAPIFPLRTFDLHMKPLQYAAGTGETFAALADKLREAVPVDTPKM